MAKYLFKKKFTIASRKHFLKTTSQISPSPLANATDFKNIFQKISWSF